MKTKLLLAVTLFISMSTFGQKETLKLPIDSLTKKITYTEVVTVENANKQELYSRAREWFSKAYNSANNVIQMDDKESGKIVGKALVQLSEKVMGSNYTRGSINYTISIYVKDGRYKFEITNFYHKGADKIEDYGNCEEMMHTKKKTWGISYQSTFNKLLLQMDTNIQSLIADLKKSMLVSGAGKSNDNW